MMFVPPTILRIMATTSTAPLPIVALLKDSALVLLLEMLNLWTVKKSGKYLKKSKEKIKQLENKEEIKTSD